MICIYTLPRDILENAGKGEVTSSSVLKWSTFNSASGDGQVVKLALELDSPLYPTVYYVIDGSIIGIRHRVFQVSGKTQLEKNDHFTVVFNVSCPQLSRRYNWQSSRVLSEHAEEEILSTLMCVLTIPNGAPQF